MLEVVHQVALMLVLALHLICVNVATAGPLVCIWLDWREGRGGLLAGDVGRYLIRASLTLFIVGMLLGIGLAMLAWDESYVVLLRERLPSKLSYGIWELVFSLVLLTVCVIWWRAPKVATWQRVVRMLLALLAATNLMYHFPFLFLVIQQLAAEETVSKEVVDAAAFRHLMVQGEIVARVVHFCLASFAVTGGMLFIYALRSSRQEEKKEAAHRVAVWGGRIALVPTLIQIPVGLWILFQLPDPVRDQFMGQDLVCTAMLGLSVFGALGLMHFLSSIALGDASRRKLMLAMSLMFLVVLLMSGGIHRAKSKSSRKDKPVAEVFVTLTHRVVILL